MNKISKSPSQLNKSQIAGDPQEGGTVATNAGGRLTG